MMSCVCMTYDLHFRTRTQCEPKIERINYYDLMYRLNFQASVCIGNIEKKKKNRAEDERSKKSVVIVVWSGVISLVQL